MASDSDQPPPFPAKKKCALLVRPQVQGQFHPSRDNDLVHTMRIYKYRLYD